jgi:hypothetical protein
VSAADTPAPVRGTAAALPRGRVEGHRAFTTLWTASQITGIRRAKLDGAPFTTTSGGPHTSAPSFTRAGVRPDDIVIPIQVKAGRLHVIAAMRVAEIVPVAEFVARQTGQFDGLREHPTFQRFLPHLDTADQQAYWLVDLWLADHPEVRATCPGEAMELVLGRSMLPIRFARVAPQDLVPTLRWQSGRGPERPIRHLAADGSIERSLTLQGIYRLTPESEAALLAIA